MQERPIRRMISYSGASHDHAPLSTGAQNRELEWDFMQDPAPKTKGCQIAKAAKSPLQYLAPRHVEAYYSGYGQAIHKFLELSACRYRCSLPYLFEKYLGHLKRASTDQKAFEASAMKALRDESDSCIRSVKLKKLWDACEKILPEAIVLAGNGDQIAKGVMDFIGFSRDFSGECIHILDYKSSLLSATQVNDPEGLSRHLKAINHPFVTQLRFYGDLARQWAKGGNPKVSCHIYFTKHDLLLSDAIFTSKDVPILREEQVPLMNEFPTFPPSYYP